MRTTRLLFIPVVLLLAACDSGSEADPGPESTAATHGHDTASADAYVHDHSHDAAHGGGDPMPFLAIMRQLSAEMAAFTHALWLEDFDRMNESARAITHHAPIDPADVQRIQRTLGDDWEGFEEADHVVHEAAAELHHSIRTRDFDVILTRLDALQRGCVACHTGYRDRLLSEGSAVSRQ